MKTCIDVLTVDELFAVTEDPAEIVDAVEMLDLAVIKWDETKDAYAIYKASVDRGACLLRDDD